MEFRVKSAWRTKQEYTKRTGFDLRLVGEKQSHGVRLAVIVAILLVSVAAVALLGALVVTVSSSTIPFDSDEANHAVDGWEVYLALTRLSPGQLYRAVTGQGFYPPLHSLLIAAGYLIGGPSIATTRMPTVIIFALTLLALAWLTARLADVDSGGNLSAGRLPLAGAAVAVAFAITSPAFVDNAVLAMLEMTGALLGLLLLAAADRAERTSRERERRLRLGIAAVIAVLIFLTKYSFGLFFLPGLIVALVTESWPSKVSRRTLIEVGIVLAVYAVLLGLWLLVTDRETMLFFFTDHPYNVPFLSEENLLYLPRRWFERYSSSGLIATMVIPLALIGIIRRWKQLAVRVASWSILAGLVILTISTTNQTRHMLPLAPQIWLLAGLGFVEVLGWLHQSKVGDRGVIVALGLVMAAVIITAIGPATTLRADLITQFEGEPAFIEAQDFALENLDLDRPALFLGDLNDQNGLLAIRWRAATRTSRSLWDLDVDFFPFEQHEHSMARTNRKPQIATVDPTFPRRYMNEVLDRGRYATIAEVKRLDTYYGPRSANPEDPLCGYATVEGRFDNWVVTIYDIAAGKQTDCLQE